MRQITKESINAFLDNKDFKKSNTTVVATGNITMLYLHGNQIAKRNPITEEIEINNCGWQSNTTKERLNGIFDCLDRYQDGIYQKNFKWYWMDGKEFKSNIWHKI